MGGQEAGSSNEGNQQFPEAQVPVYDADKLAEYKYSIISGTGPGENTQKNMANSCNRAPLYTFKDMIPGDMKIGKDDEE